MQDFQNGCLEFLGEMRYYLVGLKPFVRRPTNIPPTPRVSHLPPVPLPHLCARKRLLVPISLMWARMWGLWPRIVRQMFGGPKVSRGQSHLCAHQCERVA